MLYLVKGESATTGNPTPPGQVAELLENVVLPSMEGFKRLQDEGKILAGGVMAERRGGAMIIDAESHEELHESLASLPAWGLWEIEITPLQAIHARLEQDRAAARMREMGGR